MQLLVSDVYHVIDALAPFAAQEPWDNAGLLAGRPDQPVDKILVALDMTLGAIAEARKIGAQLIVTHHPILFHARKNLREDDPEGRVLCALIRAGLAHIAAHTNYDRAEGGVNDVLARALGLEGVVPLEDGMRLGSFCGTLGALKERATSALGGVARPYGNPDAQISRVAVCGGAGGSMWKTAWAAGAQGFVTGEIHHNDALDACEAGLCLIEAGHLETERPCVKELRMALQIRLDALQYNVMVFESAYVPF